MAERNKLASIPGQPLPERKGNFLSDLWDEASGAFARYGRRSGAQRDASLAMLGRAIDPQTGLFEGTALGGLGLLGLATHPFAVLPTGEEMRERAANAGNTDRLTQSVGGALTDFVSMLDPGMAVKGGLMATAPLLAKVGGVAKDAGEVAITNSGKYMLAKSPHGSVGGVVDGGTLRINHAEVVEAMRGKGEGKKLYKALIDNAQSQGLKVTSDYTVEKPATYIYDALERDGYDVARNIEGTLEDGAVYGIGANSPAFTISKRPSLIDPQMAAGGAVLATAPLAAKMMNKADDVADAGIIAYHGSPHSFDKFDMSKIGTGEGAQDYGRGLYFADNEGTAISYRDVLASNKEISQENLGKLTPDEMFRIGEEIQKAGDAAGFNTSNPSAFNMVLNRLAGHKSTTMHPAHDRAMLALDEVIKVIPDDIKAIVSEKITPPKGSLYKVKIDARPEELATYTGANGGDAIAFAEKAKRDGFKGVRYLDAKSRDSGAGSYNYVIFDDKLITILKKYGIPMTAGVGGAMMVAGQGMPPEFASQMGGT